MKQLRSLFALLLMLCLPMMAPAQSTLTYTPIRSFDYATYSNTSAVSAGGTIGGGVDRAGGIYSIASNVLTVSNNTNSFYGTEWLTPTTDNYLNEKLTVIIPGASTEGSEQREIVRYQSDGSYIMVSHDGSQFTVSYMSPAGSRTDVGYLGTGTETNTNNVNRTQVDVYAEGSNPTKVFVVATDSITGTVFTNNSTSPVLFTTASYPSVQNAGRQGVGFGYYSGTVYKWSKIQTFASGAALPVGVISRTEFDNTAIGLSTTAPTGGTPPYFYQWYRSTTPHFTPTSATLLTGQTATTLTDSTAVPGTMYFYQCSYSDSATIPNSGIAAVDFPAQLWQAPITVGWIGDSIETITDSLEVPAWTFPQYTAHMLSQWNGLRKVTTLNYGLPGSGTNDWTLGNADNDYATAKAAFVAGHANIVVIQLGTNDSFSPPRGYTAAQYTANLSPIVANLVSAGFKVAIGYPPYSPYDSALGSGGTARLQAYQSAIDALVDNIHVFPAQKDAFNWFAATPSELTDGIHPTGLGVDSYALFYAKGIYNALYPTATGTKRRLQ